MTRFKFPASLRPLLITLAAVGAVSGAPSVALAAEPTNDEHQHSAATELHVKKSPTCGCCGDWVEHARENGFDTHVTDTHDMNAVKQRLNIEPRYQSCHTATVDSGYFFEGHVPARYITQFLEEKPEGAAGLAVPGMPLGSPGMEMNNRFQRYQVLQINRDGTSEVYATVNSASDQ